jgi:uncharacterized repeat protein (TIGR03803 family)
MREKKSAPMLRIALRATLCVSVLGLFVFPMQAGEGTYRVIHNFNLNQGRNTIGIIYGADGNIYGANVTGGKYGAGTAFELSPVAGGNWIQTKTINFAPKGNFPSPLTFGPDGNLYGAMQEGENGACGSVFKLTVNAEGHWDNTTLHTLNCSEGLFPEGGITFDSSGNMYGTAWAGGAYGDGTVFELSPVEDGTYTFQVIHSFNNTDGLYPQSAVTIDVAGNLYGATLCGGGGKNIDNGLGCSFLNGSGTIWELSPQTDGSWKEKVLYSFTGGDDGANPSEEGVLIFDSAGNLYGTTQNGGTHQHGVAYELISNGDGTWSEKVLHNFNETDGMTPSGGLLFDHSGNLWGECYGPGQFGEEIAGSNAASSQLVFKLSPNSDGSWKETVIHRFSFAESSGPAMGMAMDSAGNFYGTTWQGGTYNNGVVFKIKP